MKKTTKILAVSLAAVMSLGIISGCGKDKTAKNDGEKPVISYFLPMDPGAEFTNDTWAVVNWGEKTGTKIEIQSVQRDVFKEKIAALLASGNIPDLINFYQDEKTTDKYGPRLFVAIDDYLKILPNYQKWLKKYPDIQELSARLEDGKMYGFAAIRDYDAPFAMWTIREDLLNKAGMSADDIKTIDDMKKACLALKKVSGQKYVTSSRLGWNYFAEQTGYMFGTSPYMMFDNKKSDGTNKCVYVAILKKYMPFIEFYKWMYENEIIHPSFATMTQQELFAGYSDGKYQLAMEQATMGAQLGAFNEKYPERVEKAIFPLEIDGEAPKMAMMPHWHNGYRYPVSVSKGSKNVEAALKAMDWLYSEEGIEDIYFGKEGEHYVKDDSYTNGYCSLLNGSWYNKQRLVKGEITQEEFDAIPKSTDLGIASVWLSPIRPEWSAFGSACDEDVNAVGRRAYKVDNIKKMIDEGFVLGTDPAVRFDDEETARITEILTPLETYASEQSLKFIYGSISMDQWDEFQAKLDEMGAAELEKIYNDRYEQLKK